MTLFQSKMDFLSANSRFAVQNDGTYPPRITRETCTCFFRHAYSTFQDFSGLNTKREKSRQFLTVYELEVSSKATIRTTKYEMSQKMWPHTFAWNVSNKINKNLVTTRLHSTSKDKPGFQARIPMSECTKMIRPVPTNDIIVAAMNAKTDSSFRVATIPAIPLEVHDDGAMGDAYFRTPRLRCCPLHVG